METPALKIIPCLWFNNQAAEAATFYATLFPNSKVLTTVPYGQAAASASGMKEGDVMTVRYALAGQEFLGLNGGPHFSFTPALSLFVRCDSQAEIGELWSALSKNGLVRMPLNKYPFAEKYGWCQDRFGVNWQMIHSSSAAKTNQKILPALLFTQEVARKAEAAMRFYTSIFPNSAIDSMAFDESKTVLLHARFHIGEQSFAALESPIPHDFGFNESMSFIVNCKDQSEIDAYWTKLSANKASEQCGWLKDKFGVSWQIVPAIMAEMMAEKNGQKRERVMQQVMKMKKIEIEPLLHAFR